MAASDRIRAPRANIGGRMLTEADSASSTPEFVIRRNLILRKRSTSDSEERPPGLGPQSSSAVANEAFKADGSRKKGVHPGHQYASPRVSRDVAVAPASHPAPPWNGQLRTSSAKTHDVGGARGSGGTLGLTSKGDNMGEESCCEHVRADESTPRELIKSSEFDPQEFRYGPGFVDKLKSRFISLSLQEKSPANSGEGTIRRYSSLENVLEQDDYLDSAKRKRPLGSLAYTNSRMPSLYVNSRNSFKRAKSMETLLLESEHNMRHRNLSNSAFTNNNNNNSNRIQRPLSACDPLTGPVLINENLVIIETLQAKGADLTSKISKKKTTNRQVSVSSINDEELPKPDIVKTCKLIFETASKRPVAHGSVRKAPVLRQSAKIQKGTPASATTQQPNNHVSGKVVQPPSNIPLSNANQVSLAQQKFGAKENSCVVVNGDLPSQPKDICSPDKETKAISSDALGRIRSQGTAMTFNGSQKGKPAVGQAHTPKSLQAVKPSSPPPPPPLDRAIEKPLVSKELPPEVDLKQQPQQATQNAEPVKLVSPTSASTPNGLSAPAESERIMKSSQRVVGGTEDSKPGELTNEEVLSPDEDSESQEEVLKPTPLLGRSKPGGLWQKAPPPSNTIVYDFRGKEVKSHLPTNPAPFGCKPAKKAKKQSAGGKGALVNGTAVDPATTTLVLGDFGESRDYDEDYDSDDLDVGAHLPAISGITFLGENIRCEKSVLLTTRNKKLKVRFIEATTTHEYPAAEDPEPSWSPQEDASLTLSGHLTNGEVGPPNGALPPSPDEDEDSSHRPSSVLRQNMAVTSTGGLSRYTPSMLSSSSDSFQLGVERLVPETANAQNNSSTSDSSQGQSGLDPSSDSGLTSSPNSLHGDEELKPADPADMSSWSSSTSTSDLLF